MTEELQKLEETKPPEIDTAKILADLNKYKKEAADLAEKLKASETSSIKSRGDWEQLAKLKEEEAKQARIEAERLKNTYITEKKFNELRTEALRLGIRKEAIEDLELVDLNQIQIETTDRGRIDVIGAKIVAEKLKATKPHWFQDKETPAINSSIPRVNLDGKITINEIYELEAEAKKTGDSSKFIEAIKKYKMQNS